MVSQSFLGRLSVKRPTELMNLDTHILMFVKFQGPVYYFLVPMTVHREQSVTVHREQSVTVHSEQSVKREKPTRCNN